MARPEIYTGNLDPQVHTFAAWLNSSNQMRDDMANRVVTTSLTSNGAVTVGNAFVQGKVASLELASPLIRGGNVQTNSDMVINPQNKLTIQANTTDITGDVSIGGNETVQGKLTVSNSAEVTGNVNVSSHVIVPNVNTQRVQSASTLDITSYGNTTQSSNNLVISSNTLTAAVPSSTFTGNVTVNQAVTTPNVNAQKVQSTTTLGITSVGAMTQSGNTIAVSSNSYTVTSPTSTMTGVLNVNQAVTTPNVNAQRVQSTSTLSLSSTGAMTQSAGTTLAVSAPTSVTVTTPIADFTANLRAASNIIVPNVHTQRVRSATDLALNANNISAVSNTFTVTSPASSMSGTLNVVQSVTTPNVNTQRVQSTTALNISGTTGVTITAPTTAVVGNKTVSGTETITGLLTASGGATVTGNVNVSSNLTVPTVNTQKVQSTSTLAVTATGAMTQSANTIAVLSNTFTVTSPTSSMSGTLSVNQAVTTPNVNAQRVQSASTLAVTATGAMTQSANSINVSSNTFSLNSGTMTLTVPEVDVIGGLKTSTNMTTPVVNTQKVQSTTTLDVTATGAMTQTANTIAISSNSYTVTSPTSTVTGLLNVNNAVTTPNVNAQRLQSTSTMAVTATGAMTQSANTIAISANSVTTTTPSASFSGDVSAAWNVSAAQVISPRLTSAGTMTITAPTSVTVTSPATSLTGTLNVTGDETVGGSLTVTGSTASPNFYGNTLSANVGNLTLKGNTQVVVASHLQGLTANLVGNVNIIGDLRVTGTVNLPSNVNLTVSEAITDNLTVYNTATIAKLSGNTTVDSTLTFNPVTGIADGNGTIGYNSVRGMIVRRDGIAPAANGIHTVLDTGNLIGGSNITITNGGAGVLTGGVTLAVNRTGLDADLLDGQHGAFYQNASNMNAGVMADARLPTNIVRNTTTVATGNGLTGGGNLSANRTLSVVAGSGIVSNATGVHADSTIARSAISISAGNGLTGGGNLTINRSLAVLAGTGIISNSTGVHLDSGAVVLPARSITAGNGLAGGGNLSVDRTISVDVGLNGGLVANTTGLFVDSTIARSSINIQAGDGLLGGGDLSANRLLRVFAGTGIVSNTSGVHVDGSVLRTTGDQTIIGTKTFNSAIVMPDGSGSITTPNFRMINGAISFTSSQGLAFKSGTTASYVLLQAPSSTATRNVIFPDADVTFTGGTMVSTDRSITTGNGLTGGGDLSANRSISVVAGTDIVSNATGVHVGPNVVRNTVSITAGNGLTGGGTLAATRSLAVGQGDGISVSATTVGVDSTVVRTTGDQIIAGEKNFTSQVVSSGVGGSSWGANIPAGFTTVSNAAVGLAVWSSKVTQDGTGNVIGGLQVHTSSSAARLYTSNTNYIEFTGNMIGDTHLNSTIARSAITITAGNGLSGGGNLTANRSLAVGQGDGISVSATAVGVDATVVRTSGNQTIGGAKVFTSDITYNKAGMAYWALHQSSNTSIGFYNGTTWVVPQGAVATTTSVATGNGLTGGGNLSATRTLSVVAGTGIISNTTGVHLNSAYVATTSASGLMAAADKSKLDGVAAGAEVNVPTNLSTTHGTNSLNINSSTGTFAAVNGATTTTAGIVTVNAQTFAGAKTFTSPVTVAEPTAASHAATKAYVDAASAETSFYENNQNITANYTITPGKNAMTAGPITVNSGVTVTIGDGQSWTVV